MAKLAINVNMFSLDQQVVLIDENGDQKHLGGAPADKLGEFAASFVQNHQVDSIQVFGQKDFSKKVVSDIKTYLNTNYSNGNVRIYLNGEIYN